MREEDHPDAVKTRGREFDVDFDTRAGEKIVRELYQQARAVARQRIAAACAAVRQIAKYRQSLLNDFMGAITGHVGNETHAASIVLESGVVKGRSAI